MTTPALPFQGKVAVVTGGSRGIGYATAMRLAADGADIAISGTKLATLEPAAAAITEATGQRCFPVEGDVRNPADMDAFVETTKAKLGRLDIAVSNAGIARDNIFLRMGEEDWDEVLQTNLYGSFNFAKAVARTLRKQRSGRIIFVASLAGMHGNNAQANYSASKGGIIALAKTLARELAKYQVLVNVVAPGLIETDMTKHHPEDLREYGRQQIPLGRFGNPEEVAGAIAFLAGPDASYITGTVFKIDGGIEI